MPQRLLFICSRNRLRSPTAEAVFSEYEGLEVCSAGLDRQADVPLSSEEIAWADLIFVMERFPAGRQSRTHRRKLSRQFQPWLKGKRVICLDIPDQYEYVQPELVDLLKRKILPLL
jgi:predicted protein tyrosine phosphatase